jgi:hypothetical protein
MTVCWCEHNRIPPFLLTSAFHPRAMISSGEDIYYTMPLTEYDFMSMFCDDVKSQTRISLFRETLLGLGKLHGCGFMHRAIRSSMSDDPSGPRMENRGFRRRLAASATRLRRNLVGGSLRSAAVGLPLRWPIAPGKAHIATRQMYGV